MLSIRQHLNHLSPEVFRCISPKAAIKDLNLPRRLALLQTLHPLKVGLRQAYSKDYGIHDLIELGSVPLQWCQNVSFTDRLSETRFTFQTGNYVRLYDTRIACLGFLFVHQLTSEARCLFCKVEKVDM